jgi:D-beta-D-heptose 7-phosphate kinase / D-beta-D-heptose 1-phosphate adenosyltransferase
MLTFLRKKSAQDLIQKQFPNISVMVIGDLMLDQYFWGNASRISPEAPVPVVNIERQTWSLGGAGNVAYNIVSLGCRVELIGIVGEDAEAESMRQRAIELGIGSSGLLIDPSRPTTTKTRVVSNAQQMMRLDREVASFISKEMEQSLLHASAERLDSVDIVILSDYAKGVLTDHFLLSFLALANQKKVRVLVDPKRQDFAAYANASAVTPNRSETQSAIGRSLLTDADFEVAAKELQDQHHFESVLMTRSEQGMTLLNNGVISHFRTQAKQVFDISGAGDAVISVLAVGLAAGLSWPEATELANLGAGIAVQKIGTSPVTADELVQVLEQEGVSAANSKILVLDDLLCKIAAWKAEGKKIAFTNGCFDILHVGHVVYLDQARGLADILIVGLNSDASVQRLKGPQRPLNLESDRTRVLAALEPVDAVILFEEDTPIDLITAIRPDVLVKGADYQEEEVVGAQLVRSYDGDVQLIPLVEGRSTTGILKKANTGNVIGQ